jgi:hypothetical protein
VTPASKTKPPPPLPPAHSVKVCGACGLNFDSGLPAEITACFEKSEEGSRAIHLTRTCPRCRYEWAEAPAQPP